MPNGTDDAQTFLNYDKVTHLFSQSFRKSLTIFPQFVILFLAIIYRQFYICNFYIRHFAYFL